MYKKESHQELPSLATQMVQWLKQYFNLQTSSHSPILVQPQIKELTMLAQCSAEGEILVINLHIMQHHKA